MRDFSKLHPELQEKATKLVSLCAENGIAIKFSECVRTKEEQDALYAKGRTAPGNIVTNAKGYTYSSQHQWGVAVDFYLDMDIDGDGNKVDDAFNNTTALFDKVGALASQVGLYWGGNWTKFKDRPHLYLGDWGSTAVQLRNTYVTPEKFFATWPGNEQVPEPQPEPQQQPAPEQEILHNDRVLNWQRKMNIGFDGVDRLEEDGWFGVKSQAFANKHYLHKGIKYCPTAVKWLQQRLNERGYSLSVDGNFGPGTLRAVTDFQMRRGLSQDGYVGKDTTYQLLLR